MSTAAPRTLYDKLVDAHAIRALDRTHVLLYVDRHVLNEYTSPQAFAGLRQAQRRVRSPGGSFAIVDHVNPTAARRVRAIADPQAARQVDYLEENCREFGIEMVGLMDARQGIEHVVVPELGLALPGMVIACGDSHTTTYGALGALGFGIGTSEVEHVLATQTLIQKKSKNMKVEITGKLRPGVTANRS